MQRLPQSELRPVTSHQTARAVALAVLLLLFGCTALLAAQKNKKAKDSQDIKASDAATLPSNGSIQLPLPDPQAIDMMVSQMLAAWQIGDEQLLHTFYSDDVLMVSGVWEPPLQGWQSYLRAYQSQRSRTQGIRLDRTNTFVKVLGTTAWCTYQWEFSGQVDGSPSYSVGQTTLLLEKRAGKWLIVANHTSLAPTQQRPVPTSAAPATPSSQPGPLASGSPAR